MYSLVLATMLTTGNAAPAGCWHSSCYGCWGCSGCYGCCGGCYGYYYGCYGCCGGCYGCCGGCYGSCHGCWGANVVYYYPVYTSCYGCCGTVVVPQAPRVVPTAPGKPKEKLPEPKKEASAGNFATVVIAAPADASLTVNGRALVLTSTEQAFTTPELEPDANYSYMVKAEVVRDGQTIAKTRKVMVKAGREVRVDFNDMATAPTVTSPVVTRD